VVRFVHQWNEEEGLGTDFLGIVELQLLYEKGGELWNLPRCVQEKAMIVTLTFPSPQRTAKVMKTPPMVVGPFQLRGRSKLERKVHDSYVRREHQEISNPNPAEFPLL